MKYIKLGSTASIFFDPTTQFKILPGEIKPFEKAIRGSKKTLNALKGGHLEYASEDAYESYISDKEDEMETEATQDTQSKQTPKSFNPEDVDDFSEEELMKLKKDYLKVLAVYHETELSEEELDKMNKAELVEEIQSLTDEE